jgi:branched-chain amino acid transport system substrate-binding protein
MGRQADAALRLFVSDTNLGGGIRIDGNRHELAIECINDRSNGARCAEIYRSLIAEKRTDILFGPYSSGLARVAAPIANDAGIVFVNHGGASDKIYTRGNRMNVGVLTPASEYMTPFLRLVAGLKLWRKRIAVVRSKGAFAAAIAGGLERACAERRMWIHGVRIRVKFAGRFDPNSTPARLFPALKRNRVNALVSIGSYQHDLAVMRAASELDIPVLGCVAAGVESFARDLGDAAAGIVGVSQWDEQFAIEPEIGPRPREFARRMRAEFPSIGCDYPAAQAYAAGILTKAALESAGSIDKLRDAFSDLRTSTLFGKFGIDRVTGRQIEHRMLLVQWHEGRKLIIDPEPLDDSGTLEFPSGWRLILTSLQMLRLTRGNDSEEVGEESGDEDRD